MRNGMSFPLVYLLLPQHGAVSLVLFSVTEKPTFSSGSTKAGMDAVLDEVINLMDSEPDNVWAAQVSFLGSPCFLVKILNYWQNKQ